MITLADLGAAFSSQAAAPHLPEAATPPAASGSFSENLALALCRVNAGTFAEIAASTGVDPFRIMDLWAAELRSRAPRRAA